MAIAGVDPTPAGPDDQAFIVSAYEAHHAEVFAFLARATRDRSLAEDLLRETFRGLTREPHERLDPDQVRRTLYRIASNLVVAPSRPRASHRSIAPQSPGSGPPAERRADIERALDGLSIDARVALLLSAAGFRGEEIAAAIVRPASATRTLLCLARGRVRVRRELFAAEGR